MADSLDISAELKEHIGTHSAELLTLAYQSMDVWNDVTVYPDVKNETTLTTLMVDKIVKPYTSSFTPTEKAIKFVPRTIGVKVAKADLLIEPEQYRQTYLAQFMPKKGVAGVSPEDLPFAKYIWEAVMAEFGEELNNDCAWAGVYNAAGTEAKDVANGYGTIIKELITAEKMGGVANIGALTADDAYEQLTALWRSIPEKYRNSKKFKFRCYLSDTAKQAYNDSLDKKGWFVGKGEDQPIRNFLRGTEQKLELLTASWMHSTDRVFITPLQNIVLPADAVQQDLAKMRIVPDVWTSRVGIACALGFNFRYGGLIWGNEVDERPE